MGKSAAFMLPCLLLLALSAQGSSCAPAFQAATAPLNAWSAAGRSLGLRGGQGQFSGCNPLAMTKSLLLPRIKLEVVARILRPTHQGRSRDQDLHHRLPDGCLQDAIFIAPLATLTILAT
ncbi:hypothetical protein T484DRAFT_3018629 [Baffinella frigidus]|nr:hypothetical protein T484DRAFT_3018629 [Cryptophyta sp. CCMP2293]